MSDRHRISLPDALAMVKRARETPPTLVKGWSIDAEIISEILAQPGARSLRAYLAATEDGVATLVYVGVNADGRDMTDGVLAELLFPCPPVCDPASSFHSP